MKLLSVKSYKRCNAANQANCFMYEYVRTIWTIHFLLLYIHHILRHLFRRLFRRLTLLKCGFLGLDACVHFGDERFELVRRGNNRKAVDEVTKRFPCGDKCLTSSFNRTRLNGGSFGVIRLHHRHKRVVTGAECGQPGGDGCFDRDYRIYCFKRFEHAGNDGIFFLKI